MLSPQLALAFCLCFLARLTVPRTLHSLHGDSFASPKYRVTFLNGLPLRNDTAQKWISDGLQGGELEFLDQPWNEDALLIPKEIGSGDYQDVFSAPHTAHTQPPRHSLEEMKIGPHNSYLCLIPKPLDIQPNAPEVESEEDVTPVHSWSLLQPLSGKCLYHRQNWFTYSYCHNKQIRQFKELPHRHPHPPGGHTPEEDPEWESYTLGRAPPTPEPGADLTVAEQSALAANLELGRAAGSRYLVQRWGDGTVCDKTGKKREVEVQFHCSMTVTDTILFVKEAKTCSYVLVIHTSRLCGEPGFKSHLDSHEEAAIRCREIVDSNANTHQDQESLPESDYPSSLPRHKPVFSPVAKTEGVEAEGRKDDLYKSMVRKALEVLMRPDARNLNTGDVPQVTVEPGEDGEMVIEFYEADPAKVDVDGLAEKLRAASFDILGERKSGSQSNDQDDEKKTSKKDLKHAHNPHDADRDEL